MIHALGGINMDDSILNTAKRKIGIDYDCTDFDDVLIDDSNSALMILNQEGLGVDGFRITGKNEKWSDFLKSNQLDVSVIKSWFALKVQMMFDPPTTNVLLQSKNEMLKELEHRFYITENYVGEI